MMLRLLNIAVLIFLVSILAWLLIYIDNRQLLLTSQPISSDQGQQGLASLNAILRDSGYNTVSLTTSYQSLENTDKLKNRRGLLFLSLPSAIPASPEELNNLVKWVESGNTVIAMLALDDRPHWHNQQNRFTIDTFINAFNLRLLQLDTPADETNKEEQASGNLFSQLPSPLTRDVNLVASSSQEPHVWQLLGKDTASSALIILRDKASLSPVAWLSRIGSGQLFLFVHSDLFSNAQLPKVDNLTLVRNIIQHSAPTDIYFDDVHHIITPAHGNTGLLLHPLSILLAGMLLYALSAGLLKRYAKKTGWQQNSIEKYVRSNSIQQARTLSDSETALKYLAHIFSRVCDKYGLPQNEQAAWRILESKPENIAVLSKIKKTYQRALDAKRFNLNKFINRLEKLRI